MWHPITAFTHFILSQTITQAFLCQCPWVSSHLVSQSVCTHTDSFSTHMLTWLKLDWEEYRLWVRSEWLDTVHVKSEHVCEKEKEEDKSRNHHLMSKAAELCQWHGWPAGNLQCKPLRWTFRCVARRARWLQVLVLAWQPPPLNLPEQLFMTPSPSLQPLSLPSSPWWLGGVLSAPGGSGWLWQLTQVTRGSRHASVRHCRGPRSCTGLWILHSVGKQSRNLC